MMCERARCRTAAVEDDLDLDPDAITWARHADRRTTGILHAPLEPTKESGVQARDRLMIKSE